MRQRHTRAQVQAARVRAIARMRFRRDNVYLACPERCEPGSWWGTPGQWSKSRECGCRLCRHQNWLGKFQREKRAFYRRLDRLNAAAW